jgi:brefeldin A-resistance guanine nucleotide exchange factor 1
MKPHVIHSLSSEIAFGLHELLRTNAANIHKSDDWFTLFSLLEVVGAAAHPPPVLQPTATSNRSITSTNVESDSECSDCATNSTTDKGYTSDSEIYRRSDYIVVSHDDLETIRTQQSILNQYKIDLNEKLSRHDRRALIKSCETLSFLIRDAAHVTQENFEYCIHCIRTFIEATVTQQPSQQKSKTPTNNKNLKQIRKATSSNSLSNENINEQNNNQSGQTQFNSSKQSKLDYDDDDDQEAIKQEYQSLALQLLDLMHTLHTRASQIYKHTTAGLNDQTTSSILWYKCWCPILQG